MNHYTVDQSQAGMTLVEYLSQVVGCSKRAAKKLLDSKRVFVNTRRVWIASHPLHSGDTIELPSDVDSGAPQSTAAAATSTTTSTATATTAPATGESSGVEVLFEEGGYFVLNKPAGILSNGDNSLESRARRALKNPTLLAVHRLDRDTSGCLLFAADAARFELMKEQFAKHAIGKNYLALVRGTPGFDTRTVRTPIDGKSATSHFLVRQRGNGAALVEAQIPTGRMHQIRKHLSELHFPVLGDTSYSGAQEADPFFRTIPRQMLHAAQVRFTLPRQSKQHTITAPLPADFRAVMQKLVFCL